MGMDHGNFLTICARNAFVFHNLISQIEPGKQRGQYIYSDYQKLERFLVQNTIDLLNLPGWIVQDVQEKDEHLLIEAKAEEVPLSCPLYGSTRPPYHFPTGS
jgi:hypothetical protein